MMTLYDGAGTCLSRRNGSGEIGPATLWIDLLNPTPDEEMHVEKALALDVPTQAEMREIEASNRFYSEDGTHVMTALVVQITENDTPHMANVTFILAGQRLVTVRYSEPKAFQLFADKACKNDPLCTSGPLILMGLIETLIQRQADHIEKLQDEVETLAPQIFGQKHASQNKGRRLDVMLRTIGKSGDLTSRAQESAVSFSRTLNYFADAARERGEDKRLLDRIETANRDVGSLVEHLKSLSGRTAFLLDATLGMISNEQNQIIKLFSVMAVMLMPPTLVASIYGMNFENMPELKWLMGYPWALGLMFVSGLVPFIYFKKKGWL